METKSELHLDKGEAAFIEKVPTLVPDWSVFMQMTSPNHTALIDLNCMVLIGWLPVF